MWTRQTFKKLHNIAVILTNKKFYRGHTTETTQLLSALTAENLLDFKGKTRFHRTIFCARNILQEYQTASISNDTMGEEDDVQATIFKVESIDPLNKIHQM